MKKSLQIPSPPYSRLYVQRKTAGNTLYFSFTELSFLFRTLVRLS